MNKLPIYLDHQATTPVDPRVLQEMVPYFLDTFGNAASRNHEYGRRASIAVESARDVIGKSINARPQDICFTSGATESINLAIKGVFAACAGGRGHFITVSTEHKAVLDTIERIRSLGAEVTVLRVNGEGFFDIDDLERAIRPETVLVSVMAANNEIGVVHPLAEIGRVCRDRNVFFMTDATQALGKIPIDIEEMKIDLLACSAHKLYGPKGIGALYCRRSLPKVPIQPLIDGGGHERGLRSGTLNVPGIVGFAKAAALAIAEIRSEQERLLSLREALLLALQRGIAGVKVNGDLRKRLAGNINVVIPGVRSESLIIALADDVAISSGSACTTARVEPSHVLKAIGRNDEDIGCSVRIGLGRSTSLEEIHFAAECIVRHANRIAALRQ
jgi:cysteine desulfurase